MIQSAEQVVPVKLDVDKKEVAPLAEKYGVSAIPAVFVMDATGKVLGKVEVTFDPAQFSAEINTIVKAHQPRNSGGRSGKNSHGK